MRTLFERICRVTALGALALAVWGSVRAARRAGDVPARAVLVLSDTVVTDTSGRAVRPLVPLAMSDRADTVVLPLGALPSPRLRGALGALHSAGTVVQWADSTRARGLAVSVSRSATPDASLSVRASAQAGGSLVLRDAGGVLDTLATAGAVSAWQLGSAATPLVVQQGMSRAFETTREIAPAQRVLVIAQPGWEGKFVVAALEESGWTVDGTMRVSPSGSVTIGTPQLLDLARYAAVVVLDSMAVDAGRLSSFVSRGGGLVLGGDALRIPSLSALRPVRATGVRGGIAGALLTGEPRRGLEAWEIEPLPDAVVLQSDASDHGHAEAALVATRRVRGRVVAMPYRETWRWRMQGTDEGAAEHRRWWQSALRAAVPAGTDTPDMGRPTQTRPDALPGTAAPYADLVARIGAPVVSSNGVGTTSGARDGRVTRGDVSGVPSATVLLAITLLTLLAEWSSRRLRGMR